MSSSYTGPFALTSLGYGHGHGRNSGGRYPLTTDNLIPLSGQRDGIYTSSQTQRQHREPAYGMDNNSYLSDTHNALTQNNGGMIMDQQS